MIYRYEIAGKIIRVKAESQRAADAYVKLVYGWPDDQPETPEPEIEPENTTDIDQTDGPADTTE